MVELRTGITAEYERLHRIAQFYKLVDEAERLAFFEYDDLAEDACQSAVNLFGALDDPKWFDDLPANELTPDQHDRLQEEVLRQLLFLAAMRAKRGLMNLGDPQHAAAYRSALEAIAAANRWKRSESARLTEVFCRVGLGIGDIAKFGFSKPIEPSCAADYYFLGMMHFWVSQMQDNAISLFLKASQPLTGVDFSNSLEQSERLLRRAASIQPHHYWTYFWLGWNRLAGKHFSASELAFDSCIALRPDYALGYAYRGWSLLLESQTIEDGKTQAGLRTRGLTDLAHARSIEPINSEFAWLTGLALAQTGQPREALQAYQRAVELEPPLSTWLGRQIYGEKQLYLQRMRDLAKTTTDKDPRNLDGWAALAAAAWALGAADDAERAAGSALSLKPDSPVALSVRGSAALERKKFDAALADFRAARAKQPKLWAAAFGEAQATESQGTPDQALGAFDSLAEVAETDWQKVDAQLGRARLLARLNRPDEAADAIKAAQAIDPRAGKSK
jgi:tetratricopeptide (TPR) repeat protein